MPSPNIMAAALARRTTQAQDHGPRQRDRHPRPSAAGRRGDRDARPPHRRAPRLRASCAASAGSTSRTAINPTRSRERFNEAHDLIIKAWTSRRGRSSGTASNYEFRYVNIWPRPLQEPHPPICIPGAGQHRDDEVLRREALHVHVGLRADARRQALVRRLPRARPTSSATSPIPRSSARRSRSTWPRPTSRPTREARAAHRVALPQGPQAGPRARHAARLHVAGLAARDADRGRGKPLQRVHLRGDHRQRHGRGRQPRHRRRAHRGAARRARLRARSSARCASATCPTSRTVRSMELFATRGHAGAAPALSEEAAPPSPTAASITDNGYVSVGR